MKKRLTITIDAEVAKRARQIAEAANTSLSAVIEESLRFAPDARLQRTKTSSRSFAQKWAGKLRLRTSAGPDPLLDALKTKYDLTDE